MTYKKLLAALRELKLQAETRAQFVIRKGERVYHEGRASAFKEALELASAPGKKTHEGGGKP